MNISRVLNRRLLSRFIAKSTFDIEVKPELNEAITVVVDPYKKDDERYISKQYKLRRQAEVAEWIRPPRPPSPVVATAPPADIPADDLPIPDMVDPYTSPVKKCIFCKFSIPIDYKNVALLSQFISPQTGFQFSQEITGLCYYKYVELEKAIMKARSCGLMPYDYKETRYLRLPSLFDPMRNNLKDSQVFTESKIPEGDKPEENKHLVKSKFFTFF